MDDFKTVHIKLSERELQEIDEWKAERRIRTRSEALRRMIRASLENAPGNDTGLSEKPARFSSPSTAADNDRMLVSKGVEDMVRDLVKSEVDKVLKKPRK